MSVRRESRSDEYDVVVVGSGIGGLTSAAVLAHEGRRVLVVERHDRPGGYAHSFARGGYRFDAAVHLVGGCQRGVMDGLLRYLRVRDRCEFIQADPFYSAYFPGARIDVPANYDGFIDAHTREFPADAAGIQGVIDLVRAVAAEVRQYPLEPSMATILMTPRKAPTLFRYRNATLGGVLARRLGDPHARAAIAALWPYLGVPPARLSFVYWASMLASYLEDGAAYCRGSWQGLANALAESVRRDGGEVLLASAVRGIETERRRVIGVRLENGQRIGAPTVISNTDPIQTFEQLLAPGAVPGRYRRRVHRYRPSLSAFVLFLATDLDVRALGAGHEMLISSEWDADHAFGEIVDGRIPGIGIDIPTLLDASLAPKGEHVLITTALIPYSVGASWRQEKSRFAEAMMAEVERRIPGIRDHIRLIEGATPRTMERYTLNMSGSVYGWEVTPGQVGPGRLASHTPVDGLHLAGHWTRPGGGIYAVAISGIHAAESILDRELPIAGWRGHHVPG